jgi:predicted DNA-binding transcriptional regulator AlpA
MQDSEVLRPPRAAEYVGVSLRQLYNIAAADPAFPRKIVFSPRCVGWRRESLDAWLRAKEGA